jgi:DNA (cytosine-5)-methyltransferase 1
MRVGSLFAGIGGFDLGLEMAGMESAWQSEIESGCLEVLVNHWPSVGRHGDVQQINGSKLPAVDLICGGFPCQDLSVAGRRSGLAGERSGLWFEFHRILEEHRPAWVVIENVPGLLSSNGGRDFAIILRGLVELGYGPAWRILDAQHFGVPQRRRRLFIVGHLGDYRAAEVLFEPESLRGDIAEGGETREEIAGTLESRTDGGGFPGTDGAIAGHVVAFPDPAYAVSAGQGGSKHGSGRHNQDTFVVAGAVTGAESHNGNSNPIAENLVIAAPLRSRSHPNSNMPGRGGEDDENLIVWNEEQITSPEHRTRLDGKPHINAGGRMMIGVRRLTPTEVERLQGFPDGWTNDQSDSQRYRMLGNAICVPVTKWLGERILYFGDLSHKEA